jgi:post-segregation antitoxin (ccd killing protein)
MVELLLQYLDEEGASGPNDNPDSGMSIDVVRPKVAVEVDVEALSRARKVSVSMPAVLTAAVQRRVGPGEFSQYVTEAVARQFKRDLLDELSELLEAEHGPVPVKYLEEAKAAWPDAL